MEYYTEIKSEHTESCMCELLINWNPVAIAQSGTASGYIVQHFSRKLITEYQIDIPQNTSYYEAWKVTNGIVTDRGEVCDDIFSIGNDWQYFDLFKKCAGTSGKYVFKGDVFWIPESHRLFDVVSSWNEQTVKSANGLKATFECDDFNFIEAVFSRLPFEHEWDLTDEAVIYDTAKKMLFRYCYSQNDRERLLSKINNVIPSQYEYMNSSLIDEWDKQWK